MATKTGLSSLSITSDDGLLAIQCFYVLQELANIKPDENSPFQVCKEKRWKSATFREARNAIVHGWDIPFLINRFLAKLGSKNKPLNSISEVYNVILNISFLLK